ncbi:MAG: hypothetical protein DRO39_02480 [Thermoprotei archaeon]|nr:MAG: hypothetical protein DRO39_02480 [Thermoprotei archaeon]
MGKYGLYKVTLSERAYNNFRRLKRLLGAETWEELSEKLLELVQSGAEHRGAERPGEERSREGRGAAGRGSRAMEILARQGILVEDELPPKIRNRDALFKRLGQEGAVVVETARRRVAVHPGLWREFVQRLAEIDTSNEEEVERRLGSEKLSKLFKVLREDAEIYFDATEKKWRFVEQPPGARS